LRRVGILLALALCARVAAADGPSHDATPGSHHPFDDVDQWVGVFDDPARDAWQKPRELVAALHIRPGTAVADLGAGTGYFSRHLARAVGPHGTVFAVDVEPNLVVHLRERAEHEQTENVVPVLASTNDARLPTGRVDLVLIVDTYHHIDDRLHYLPRLKGALAKDGRVAIVEWQKRELPVGPEMAHKIARELVVDEMTSSGYRLVDEPDVLPYQYVLVFGLK
jgi:ubiquinone/menaquinone biosynthesis C-methylase UbiE